METVSSSPIDIFVVDDEHVIGQTLGIILRQAGYVVRVFSDGYAALKDLHTAPRLLISDQQMRGLSGSELASVVSHEVPEAKVLLFSGTFSPFDFEREQVKANSRGTSLLAKPLHPLQLLARVKEMIGAPAAA